VPYYEDNEKTFDELKERIAKTIAFIQTVPPEKIDGTEDDDIILKVTREETCYKGMQLLLGHSLPNVYFHVAAAYNILRHNGVDVGKRDFLGDP